MGEAKRILTLASSPKFNTISSTSPRVFINAPMVSASRQGTLTAG